MEPDIDRSIDEEVDQNREVRRSRADKDLGVHHADGEDPDVPGKREKGIGCGTQEIQQVYAREDRVDAVSAAEIGAEGPAGARWCIHGPVTWLAAKVT